MHLTEHPLTAHRTVFAAQPFQHPIAPWLQEEDSSLNHLLVGNASLPRVVDHASNTHTPRASSPHPSMAMTGYSHTEAHSLFSLPSTHSERTASDGFTENLLSESSSSSGLPSMSRSDSSAPSSSVDTWVGRDTLRQTQLDINANGHSVAPAAPDTFVYECALSWLDCGFETDDIDQWKTHCMSHFHPHEPPKSFQCPLCPFRGGPFKSGFDAWEVRLNHVAIHHRQGHDLSTSRPDFELVKFMFKKKLISNKLYMHLRSSKQVTNQVTLQNDRRRRQQPQSRHTAVPHRAA